MICNENIIAFNWKIGKTLLKAIEKLPSIYDKRGVRLQLMQYSFKFRTKSKQIEIIF